MKYFLIAGEASGDLHGANLMHSIKTLDAHAEFHFYGGDLMQAQGGTLLKHYSEMAFMGFVEVLANLQTINQNLTDCKAAILKARPDVLVLIDYPGFNLRMAAYAKSIGIKVSYFISPKIWAWNQGRVHKIKKVVDQMLCILPFEVDFYKKFGMEVQYVGNPLKDAIANYTFQQDFIAANNLPQKPIIAILPGSRKMELLKILPTMLAVQNHFPNHQFIVAAAPGLPASFYEQFNLAGAKLLFNCTYDILANAEMAMVTSGTATLETALLNVPQVVCYKANSLSVFIARLLVKIKYISLVNLIADQQIVIELIQQDCTVVNIAQALKVIAVNELGRSEQLTKYQALQQMVGPEGASLRAASAIYQFVNHK